MPGVGRSRVLWPRRSSAGIQPTTRDRLSPARKHTRFIGVGVGSAADTRVFERTHPRMSATKRARDGKTRVAIAFDIDGVYKYGREWSADGLEALQKVTKAEMPFVFVTNGGGGLTEAAYASSMASEGFQPPPTDHDQPPSGFAYQNSSTQGGSRTPATQTFQSLHPRGR